MLKSIVIGLAITCALSGAGNLHSQEPSRTYLRNERSHIAATYDTITALDASQSKSLFATLTAQMKADIWTLHLETFLARHPELTEDQKSVVLEALALIAAGAFEVSQSSGNWRDKFRGPLQLLQQRVKTAFEPGLAREAFLVLGDTAVVPWDRRPEFKNSTDRSCDCSTESDWCDSTTNPDPYCTRSAPLCSLVGGCGFLLLYTCNGNCSSSPGTFTPDPGLGSPILIDVDGGGYRLTSLDNGVEFDLRATGSPQRVSWTDPHRGNALLALDRNNDGLINDGRELFGDITWQRSSQDPNGFRALALFDMNGDSRIDTQDLVFSKLRLWIDSSHDGISQPHELFTLPDFGIATIYLDYKVVNRRDPFGQLLRYMSFVDVMGRGRRPIYDVFFTVEVE